MYQFEPYDIWFIKSNYNIGQHDYIDEFCENCKIQSVLLYTAAPGQPMLHIKYILEPEINNQISLSIDLQKHDISYIFKRKWDTDIHNVHCELFRKFAVTKIQDLHEDLMSSYWHIDNMPIWRNELSHEWD